MLNHAILMGRLTRDPELKTTQNGKSWVNFSIAVPRDYSPANGERETDFIDVVAWGKTAEFVCNWFTKGRLIVVQGSIQQRSYSDRDGNNRKATEINASNVGFAGDKAAENQTPQQPPANYRQGISAQPVQRAVTSPPQKRAQQQTQAQDDTMEYIANLQNLADDDLPF